MRGRRLPPRLNSILPSSGLLRGVRWFATDVTGLLVGSYYHPYSLSKMVPIGSPETSV
jgi:hypothetical protein